MRPLLLALLLASVGAPEVADAQGTGGRIGGSRGFGGGGGSSGGGGGGGGSFGGGLGIDTSPSIHHPPAPPPAPTPGMPDPLAPAHVEPFGMPEAPPAPPPELVPVPERRRPGAGETRPTVTLSERQPEDAEVEAAQPHPGRWERAPADATKGVVVGAVAFAAVFFGLLAIGFFVSRFVDAGRRVAREAGAGIDSVVAAVAAGSCEVRRVTVAFDWSARRELQAALDGLAGRYDLDTAHGMYAAARGARALLDRHLDGARYAMFQTFRRSVEEAEPELLRIASDLRARFAHETVDNLRRREAPEQRSRRDEGEGLVVVTLLVGTTHPLGHLPAELDAEAVSAALATLLPVRPDDLVALEILWSPSEEDDRMSSAELEVLYPELLRIDPDDEGVGRVACGHCRAVHAAELGRCPACGAASRT